jgi:hypothetical protein
MFDLLLFGPGNVVRTEERLEWNRKLDHRAGVRCQQSLSNRYVQHSPKHPQLLVYRCSLNQPLFAVTFADSDFDPLTESLAKV